MCKQKLVEKFGYWNVIKVAIGSFGADYIILRPNSNIVDRLVEVKSTKRSKYIPLPHDIKQFHIIKQFSKQNNIPVEYWVKVGRGQKNIKVYSLDEFENIFLKNRGGVPNRKRNKRRN